MQAESYYTSNILVGMSSESHVSLKEKMVCDELVVCLDSASQIAFILGRMLLIFRWITCRRGEIGRQSYICCSIVVLDKLR